MPEPGMNIFIAAGGAMLCPTGRFSQPDHKKTTTNSIASAMTTPITRHP